MSGYLNYMYAAARDAEIGERAIRGRPAPDTSRGHDRRLRGSMARFLLGLAIRLDRGLQPTVRPSTSVPCT
jgi:hypothetical protein